MSEQGNGGPAFPCMPPQDTAAGCAVGYLFPDSGMSLRDYFAAAVIGHLSASPLRQECATEQDAAYAYTVADAMLKARAAHEGKA